MRALYNVQKPIDKGQYLAKNEPISDDIFTLFGFDVLTK